MATPTSERTHYEILGVQPDTPAEIIRAAYKALAKSRHPDRNPEDPDAAKEFARINAAHDVLTDPSSRRRYDESLARESQPQRTTESAVDEDTSSTPPTAWDGEESISLDDLVDEDVVAPDTYRAPTAPADYLVESVTRTERLKLLGLTALASTVGVGFWLWAAIGDQMVSLPSGVSSWAPGAVFLGVWCMPLVVVGVVRGARRPTRPRWDGVDPLVVWRRRQRSAAAIITLLAAGAVLAGVLGWNAWRGGVTWLPFQPAAVLACQALTTWWGRRAWRAQLQALAARSTIR